MCAGLAVVGSGEHVQPRSARLIADETRRPGGRSLGMQLGPPDLNGGDSPEATCGYAHARCGAVRANIWTIGRFLVDALHLARAVAARSSTMRPAPHPSTTGMRLLELQGPRAVGVDLQTEDAFRG